MYPEEPYTTPEYRPTEPQQEPKPKKNHAAAKIVALALCCSLVGGALGAGGVYLATSANNSPSGETTMLVGSRDTKSVQLAAIDTGKLLTPAQVYAQNVNSTVGITTAKTTNYWGFETTSAAAGSGFILTEDGYILTNYHVIEGSDQVTVTLYDDTTYDAQVIGYDASNDIAVLKVEAQGLTPVVLGNSDSLNVGDSVVAIGNPLGELTFSLTSGTVSALDRTITLSGGVTMDLIQTDCAINSGNSGGALFNLYGEVVGITNAKYSSNGMGEASIDNIGFAIPVNHVQSIITSIIEKGYIVKPYIGVSVTDVSAETQRYGLPEGASIQQVAEDSPAAKAGLQVNDIITQVDDTVITGSGDLVSLLRQKSVGDELNVKVYRQGESLEMKLTVGEQTKPAMEEQEQNVVPQSQNVFPFPFPFG